MQCLEPFYVLSYTVPISATGKKLIYAMDSKVLKEKISSSYMYLEIS